MAAIVPVSADDLELAPRLTDPQAELLWKQIGSERSSGASVVFDAPEKAVAYLGSTAGRKAPRTPAPPRGRRRLRRAMRVALAEAFQRDVRTLSEAHRLAVFDALLALPRAVGAPRVHAGLGIRKLQASGIWGARAGLGLRIVFALEADLLTLVRVGSHDSIRRFLRQL